MLNFFLKLTLLLTITTLIFSSCEKDTSTLTVLPLHHSWNVTGFTAGLAGGGSLDRGDVIWTFNSNNTLDIQINTTLAPTVYLPLEATQTISYSDNGTKITIDNVDYDYLYENSGRKLILSDHPELDGPTITLER